MRRKVIKHGPASHVISLPSDWVKKYGIIKGSELDVITEEDNIIIRSSTESPSEETKIDITGLDRTSIMYILRSLYRLGYDLVDVRFDETKTTYQRKNKEVNVISVIHKEIDRLIGYEIIDEKERSCKIKDLQTINFKEFDQVLRRIFLLLKSMSEEFLNATKEENNASFETFDAKHDTITKFVSYCLRILNKKGYIEPKKTSYYYHIIALLDRITDIIKYAARNAMELDKKFDKKSIDLLSLIHESITKYYELFYKYENKDIHKINNIRYTAEKMLKDISKNISEIEIIILADMFQICEILLDLIEARTALEY
ncbi:hypothetical protein C0585_08130 [Candidatus Woesearchaeota archaeon]|nr:MAG: hypothetical protein C0585_08130 [Candidatus Woesearchaeota archaeon]